MIPSPACCDLVKRSEACKLKAYLCPAGVPTIGWGHTAGVTHQDVIDGKTITQEEADRLLVMDLQHASVSVFRDVLVPLTQPQFDALVSFTYNAGAGAFHHSGLRRKVNARDYPGAAAEFGLWVHADGKVEKGLVTRRAAEKELFETAV